MPKVSVLLPIYKTNEVHLRECIDSILGQTFTDFELLVLDDCPLDSRENVVKSYSDSRIKYFKNEQNMGISASRNKLLSLAQGDYLAICDHDDISRKDRFEKQADYLDKHPEVGVVSAYYHNFLQNTTTKLPETSHEIKLALMNECALAHPVSMIRKSVLDNYKICYEADYSPAEDYRMWVRLIDLTEFYNFQEPLLDYREFAGNTSNLQDQKMFQCGDRIKAEMRTKYPALWTEYTTNAIHTTRIQLFGFLPIITIRSYRDVAKIFLFEKILLLKMKSYRRWKRKK